jgi:hypothetical protein
MLRRYCELDVDDFIGDYASLVVTGEPLEVALVAEGLFGKYYITQMACDFLKYNANFGNPPYNTVNGIIPSFTTLVATVLATRVNQSDHFTFVSDNGKGLSWSMFGRSVSDAELYIISSPNEIRRLDAMLTTDEGWYS